jgi:signal transduction histidine kinase
VNKNGIVKCKVTMRCAKCICCIFLLCVGAMVAGCGGHAAANDQSYDELWDVLEFTLVQGQPLALDEVRALPATGWRRLTSERAARLGYRTEDVWVRMKLSASTDGMRIIELPTARTDYVDWYVVRDGNLVGQAASGTMRRHGEDELNMRHPTLMLMLRADEVTEVYMRLHTETAIRINFLLWDAGEYIRAQKNIHARIAFLFGLIVATIALALLFVWSTRDFEAVFFPVAYFLIGIGLASHAGFLQNLPWMNSFFLNKTLLLTPFIWGVGFMWLHARHFLDAARRRPSLARIISVGAICLFAVGFMLPWLPWNVSVHLFYGAVVLAMLLILVMALILANHHTAFYLYFSAILMFCAYVMLQILFLKGLIPYRLTTEMNGLAVLVLAMSFFVVAMAFRVRDIRLESSRLRREADKAQREEAVRLEKMVCKRTAELHQAKLLAEEANQSKSDFFAQISHDLRAPLNWLVGLAGALWLESEEQKLSGGFKEYLHYIKRGSYYLMQLVENIMDMDAIENRRGFVVPVEFDVREWSDSLEAVGRSLAKSTGITLEWECISDENDTCFCGDSTGLSQILMNLLHNAIKCTPDGRTVRVAIHLADERFEISVADEGPGLPADMDKLFEKYGRGDLPGTSHGGSGLGLHIVKTHVQRMGAMLQYAARPRGGTILTLIVPRCRSERTV